MGNGYGYGYGYGYGMGTGADPGILEGGSKIKFMKGEGTGGGVHESSFGKYTGTIVSCMLFTLLWYPPVINATPLCAPKPQQDPQWQLLDEVPLRVLPKKMLMI